jgi:hypothetical protein
MEINTVWRRVECSGEAEILQDRGSLKHLVLSYFHTVSH